MTTLHDCIRALAEDDSDHASVQNDIGFNGSDSAWGNRLAGLRFIRWQPGEYAEAYQRMAKYQGQLARKGLNWSLVPATEPVATVMTATSRGICERCGEAINPGEPFGWGRNKGARVHATCPVAFVDVQVDGSGKVIAGNAQGRQILAWERGQTQNPTPDPQTVRIAPTTQPEAFSRPSRIAVPDEDSPTVRVLGPGGVIAQKLPGYESRPQQLDMARLVERSIAEGEDAVIEAGTGTGKSLGYLVPAILSGKRTVVSTADKALQAQIWNKDIPFLQDVMPQPFSAAILKGRQNYVCLRELKRLRGEGQKQNSLFGGPEFKTKVAAEAWDQLDSWLHERASDDAFNGDLEAATFQIPNELRAEVTADSDSCTGKKCPLYAQCYAEAAKKRAEAAQIIVVNHALLMRDLAMRSMSGGHMRVLPTADVIVLDEAHHLEDQATDALGVELNDGSWRRIVRRLTKLTVRAGSGSGGETEGAATADAWEQRIAPVTEAYEQMIRHLETRLTISRQSVQRLGDERDAWQPVREALDPFLSLETDAGIERQAHGASGERYSELCPATLEGEERAQWFKVFRAIGKFATNLSTVLMPDPSETFVRFIQIEGSNGDRKLKLSAKPIDVAPFLRIMLFDPLNAGTDDEDDAADYDPAPGIFNPTVISTSATISSTTGFAYWRSRVGMDTGHELEVGSPFDYRKNAVLYTVQDGEQFDPTKVRGNDSGMYLDRIAAEYERLILASRGRAFALFTKIETMNEIHRRLSPRLRQFTVLKQFDAPRPELIKRFKADGNAVLFGVKSFWEGVDVQGEALSMVIIDKLPFTPPDDPVWAARCDRANARARERGERGWEWAWFNELAIPVVSIALKQGFGRLIRTKTDKGVVALLDGRLRTKNYGSRIIRSLPPATETHSLEVVQALF